jgi:hypothetical protein
MLIIIKTKITTPCCIDGAMCLFTCILHDIYVFIYLYIYYIYYYVLCLYTLPSLYAKKTRSLIPKLLMETHLECCVLRVALRKLTPYYACCVQTTCHFCFFLLLLLTTFTYYGFKHYILLFSVIRCKLHANKSQIV